MSKLILSCDITQDGAARAGGLLRARRRIERHGHGLHPVLGARRVQLGARRYPLAHDVKYGLILIPLDAFGQLPSLDERGLVAAYLFVVSCNRWSSSRVDGVEQELEAVLVVLEVVGTAVVIDE